MALPSLADTPDALFGVLTINIAIGALYWGLPAARYRDRLFDEIAAAFRALEVPDQTDQPSIHNRLMDDHRIGYSEHYHTVSMWRSELPVRYDESIDSTMAGKQFPRRDRQAPARWWLRLWRQIRHGERQTGRVKLPWRYRWFRMDGDKRTSLWIATIVPVGLVWPVIFSDTGSSWWWSVYAFLAFGQVWVGSHLWAGHRMVKVHGRGFETALRSVFYYRKEEVVGPAVSSLESATPSDAPRDPSRGDETPNGPA